MVESGDTLWGIVERHYGRADWSIVREVAAVSGIEDPSLILPGQAITLPAADFAASNPPTAQPVGNSYIVVRGDTLWDIVHSRYGDAGSDTVWHVAAVNGLENPSLIFPGQSITLPDDVDPTDPPRPTSPVTDQPDPQPPSGVEVDDATPTPGPTSPMLVPAPTPPLSAEMDTAPSTMPSNPILSGPFHERATAWEEPQAADRTTPQEPHEADDRGEIVDEGSWFEFGPRTLWASLPVGSLLLAGLVAMRRRLRTRRMAEMTPGERVGFPPATAAGTDLAVTRRSRATERVATLNALVRSLTPNSPTDRDPPKVRAVQLGSSRVEVLLSEPAPFPPPGWSTVDGGHCWVHTIGAPATAKREALLTPALVTVGVTEDGDELLMDLETAGSTAITGDRGTVLGVVRSIVLELVSCPLGESSDVYLIGFDVDGVEHGDQVRTNATLDYVARAARHAIQRQAETGTASIGATRATYGDDGFSDAAVFVIDTRTIADAERPLLDEMVSAAAPGSGAAVVLLGEHVGAREHLVVGPTGTTTWLGTEVRVPNVTREAAAQAAVMLDDAADPEVEPVAATPPIVEQAPDSEEAERASDTPSTDGSTVDESSDDHDVPDRYTPPEYDVLVRVLDGMSVDGARLTAPQVELLTLLAMFRPRRPNIDTLVSTLDPDMKIAGDEHRYIQKRMSKLRTTLGQGSDGEDLIPPNAGGRGQHARYGVSLRVTTDIELLEHRLDASTELSTAEALEVLAGGLDLLTGPPFRAPAGYDWAAPEGFTSRIANLVNSYTIKLMELAAAASAIDLVYAAASAAFRVVEDPLASLPVGRAAHLYVDAFGDPELTDLVEAARRKALAYAASTDPQATTR